MVSRLIAFVAFSCGPEPKEVAFLFTALLACSNAGKFGVFLGPDDSLFAVLGHKSSTVSVYHTATFKGKGPAAYTIQLARPASLGAGLFAGPAALGVPREGAEAAAAAAKKAADEAAAKAKAAEEGAVDGTEGDGEKEKEKEQDVFAEGPAAGPGAGAAVTATGRVPRWAREDDSDDEDEEGNDSFIPVLGIGPAYQGGGTGQQQQHQPHQHAGLAAVAAAFAGGGGAEGEEVVGEQTSHTGGGVLMWHAAGGKLVMVGLPEPGVAYAAGDDSDDPDAEEEETDVAKAPHRGQVRREKEKGRGYTYQGHSRRKCTRRHAITYHEKYHMRHVNHSQLG